jgi:hypothetical protein
MGFLGFRIVEVNLPRETNGKAVRIELCVFLAT